MLITDITTETWFDVHQSIVSRQKKSRGMTTGFENLNLLLAIETLKKYVEQEGNDQQSKEWIAANDKLKEVKEALAC